MVTPRSSRLREAEVTSDPSRESPTVGRRSGFRHIVDAEERIISPAIRNRHSSVGNKRRRREGHCRYKNSECRLKRRCVSPVAGVSLVDVDSTESDDRSSNDGHESESSMSVNVSASEVDETVKEMLPRRIFATDRYPRKGRVNSYSKPQYLVDILTILDGTPELEILMNSPLRSLFSLPVRRCSLSGKLVHNMLCRQIVTNNAEEIWFTFGGHPLRFSLEEFEKVTGLPCGPYPDQLTIASSQRQAEGAAPFLNTLLGAEVDVTIEGIVNILKAEPGMDGWKKLRLVLIVIVEGILICGTQPIRPGLAYVEMVKNLDFFLSFPWGRLAFQRTVRMLQVGDKICTQSTIVKKLKQKSLVVHGFPIAIQLMIFDSIPLLLRYLPSYDDAQTFSDRLLSTLPPLKTYHTENIFAVENDEQLEVFQNINLTAVDMCGSRSDGSFSDPNVNYMLKLIHGGYSFSKADWVGGDDSLDKLCICKKKSDMPCNCGSSFAYDDKGKSAAGTCTSGGVDNGSEIAKLWVEVAWMKKLQCSSIGMLRASIVSDIYSLVGLTKCLNCRSSPRICHAEYPLSVRTGSEACGAQPAELLYSCHQNDSVVDKVLPQPPDAHKFSLSPDNVQICTGNVHADVLPGQVPNDLLLTESSRSQTVSPCNVLVPAPALHCSDRVSQKLAQCPSHLNPIDCTLPTQLLSDRCRVPPRKICKGSLTLGKKHLLSIPLRCGYIPFRPPQTDLISRFKEQLQKYRKSSYDIEGCDVGKTFFAEIYTPECWLSQTHIDFMVRAFWNKCGSHLASCNIVVVDSLLTQLLSAQYCSFVQASSPSTFVWHPLLASCVEGTLGDRSEKTRWLKDVHTVYTPMNWGNRHWVCLVISLDTWHIDILDPLLTETSDVKVSSFMAPLVRMLPHLIMSACEPDDIEHVDSTFFSYSRLDGLAQNTRGGDCGAYAIKFIEMHSHGYEANHLSHFSNLMVDNFRMEFALDVYKDFIGKLRVQ